jgi:hypothetical protein
MAEESPKRREIYLITKSEDKGEDKWSTVERISKVLSIAAIPIVLAMVGWIIQARLQDQTVSRDYVQLAVSILRDPDKEKVPLELRDWAVDLLNENSPTKFSPEVTKKLKSGETTLPMSTNTFGTAGTVTARADKSAVFLNFKEGERLRYRLKVEGATPVFNLASSRRSLWSSGDSAPSSIYERVWPKDESEIDADNEMLTFAVSFVSATKFTLTVERIDKSSSVVEIVKNKDYQSADASDQYFDALRVTIKR